MNKTLDYYNKHAKKFVKATLKANFNQTQDLFLSYLEKNSTILDFGCGSGRDTKYFLSKGFKVDAIDGSEELCKLASEYTGIQVQQMLFQDLNKENIYDGIWACSSILHLSKIELEDVFNKLSNALKENGILYTSFKYGEFEGVRNGRYFIDFTENSLETFIQKIPSLLIEKEWVSKDVRPGRENEKWLNLILHKKGNF